MVEPADVLRVNRRITPTAVEWAITAYSAALSASLWEAWRHAPLERGSWLFLAVWMLPMTRRRSPDPRSRPAWPFVGALVLTTLGVAGSLNAACHAGLALALAGLAGTPPRTPVWLAASVSWMPACGWLLQHWPGEVRFGTRLALAATGAALVLFPGSRAQRQHSELP